MSAADEAYEAEPLTGANAVPGQPQEPGEASGVQDAESECADAVAREVAENNALAAVFDDVRVQSSDSQLVEPTRWAALGIVPDHLTADEFEMLVYEYLEDAQATAAAAQEVVEAPEAVPCRTATRAVGVPPSIAEVLAQRRAAEAAAAAKAELEEDAGGVDGAAEDAPVEAVGSAAEAAPVDAAASLPALAVEPAAEVAGPSPSDDRSPFANLKIPEGYQLVELEGEWVLVPVDEGAQPTKRTIDCVGIVALVGAHSYYLYDSGCMTDAFAHWAFLAAEDNNVVTFVDCVREDSRVYPRPLAATSLNNAPFRLSDEEIERTWDEVCQSGAYPDIQRTTASNGDVYYFSTEHLTPAYAASLAEWASVERHLNV